MVVAVIGSRGITAYGLLEDALRRAQSAGLEVSVVLSGGARGVDQLGERWAKAHGVPVQRFLPAWAQFGRRAAILRNVELIGQADAVVALHTGTPGTRHALGVARGRGLLVWEYAPDGDGVRCLAQPVVGLEPEVMQ